jgi:hypothetical protein
MPNTNPDSNETVQVKDKRTRPLGILPQNMQVRVMGGLAALMIVVIALSGRNQPKEKHVTAPPPTITDPNTARIQEYEKAVAEQTRKLQMEQAQLARTQQAYGLPSNMGMAAGAGSPSPAQPYLAYSRPPESLYGSSNQESSIQADLKKREYDSLFASNIALSYRTATHTGLGPSLSQNVAPATPAPFILIRPRPNGRRRCHRHRQWY